MRPKIYSCYFDGCCEPKNPGGIMGWGIYVIGDGPQERYSSSGFCEASESNTCNVAEYLGLIHLLKRMQKKKDCIIIIYGDSLLVISQMNGDWRIKKGPYASFARQALVLLENLRKNNQVILRWVPRELNSEADIQSKLFKTKVNLAVPIEN